MNEQNSGELGTNFQLYYLHDLKATLKNGREGTGRENGEGL